MRRSRPIGLSPGGAAFLAAWAAGLGIARLTGAPAVILLLVAALVTFAASSAGGWLRIRQVAVESVTAPTVTTVGEHVAVSVRVHDRRRAEGPHLALTIATGDGDSPLARLDLDGESGTATLAFPDPGVLRELVIGVESAGPGGILWWRRRSHVAVDPVHVAPVPAGDLLPVEATTRGRDGEHVAARGPTAGDVDGIRQWREGDADHAVHWPSTLRAGELIVRDRSVTSDTRWTVHVAEDTAAERLRHTLEDGLRRGHDVVVCDRAGGANELHPVRSADDAARWSSVVAASEPPPRKSVAVHRRALRVGYRHESLSVSASARWIAAAAGFTAVGMLAGALSSGPATLAGVAAGVAAGAVVSIRYGAGRRVRPAWLKLAVAAASVVALVVIAAEAQGIDGMLRALRGPLPDLLIVLLVIHGFEAIDRRTVRVHLAISAVVVAYATGLRIDERVAWWLAAWGALFVLATRATARASTTADRPSGQPLRAGRRAAIRFSAAALVIAASTVGLLGLIPIPAGPANLGLPALADGALDVGTRGALAGPDGSISRPGDPGDGTRGALGQVGGYPGFSETLDTSIRGDLGDGIVLRVKAPEPAFWRGQTFTDFDGRFWTVSPERGVPRSGPTIDIAPTIGDLGSAPTTDFVQTFSVESDLPNVVFAAATPSRLMFDGTVFARPDGALRAGATLAEGSVYTVVSRRVEVTADSLRDQGDVAAWFEQFDDPLAREILAPYLALPPSTTERTIALAGQLRAATTFDSVMAYQDWLAANTVYDLRAPVPPEGADAVDDYLFTSQRGFCEQIASSLVVMLRSQGVPARLATGYLPGERDRVSGVWQVRARDAHAWVEVWFPASGWQPFDPTAEVPLSGDVENGTVGGDLLSAAIASSTTHLPELVVVGLAGLAGLGALRLVSAVRRRRARGRWGVLQDRFAALRPRTGDPGGSPLTNPALAAMLDQPDAATGAPEPPNDAAFVAAMLDRVGFDPTWTDRDADYALVRDRIERLERTSPDPVGAGARPR